jgi:hypothetical protein
MERRFHASQEFDQVYKLRITTRIPAPADRDPADIVREHLQIGQDIVCNG